MLERGQTYGWRKTGNASRIRRESWAGVLGHEDRQDTRIARSVEQ